MRWGGNAEHISDIIRTALVQAFKDLETDWFHPWYIHGWSLYFFKENMVRRKIVINDFLCTFSVLRLFMWPQKLHSGLKYLTIVLSAKVWRAARIQSLDTYLSRDDWSSINIHNKFTQDVGFVVCPDMFSSIAFTSFACLTAKVWKFFWVYFHLFFIKPVQSNTS